MSGHKGGQLYDSLMLKQKSWRTMYLTNKNATYWPTFGKRSKARIVNIMMSRLGVSGPYGAMKLGMMLGTCVSTTSSVFTISPMQPPELPVVEVNPMLGPVLCSSAFTNLTKVAYQRGIDMSKHGSSLSKPAPCRRSYSIEETQVHDGELSTVFPSVISHMPSQLLGNSMMVVSTIEAVDGVELSEWERVAAASLVAFLARCDS
ncbi:hypothetical protein DL765_003020 [Monosporascus sp. GIB2]|nr:hypothetical protein DL765_003020 [Monosporascus sp. GIB2]